MPARKKSHASGLLDVVHWTKVMIGPYSWPLGLGSNKNDNKQNDTRRYLDEQTLITNK